MNLYCDRILNDLRELCQRDYRNKEEKALQIYIKCCENKKFKLAAKIEAKYLRGRRYNDDLAYAFALSIVAATEKKK